MIGFVRGIIHAFSKDYVLIDVNGVGYRINFYHPEKLTIGEEITIYTYQNVREDEISLFGFLSLDEYDLFIKLISVKGLGPRIASNMLSVSTPEKLIEAIENNNLDFIKKMPGIGNKTASQIILDLKGKLVEGDSSNNEGNQEVIGALKSLGYKQSEISSVMKNLKGEDLPVDQMIKKALGMLSKR